MLAIIVVPMAQVYMFGLLVGNKKHAWCLFNVMLALYVLSFVVAWYFETRPNPVTGGTYAEHGRQGTTHWGDEQRLWGTSCTAIDNGSVNSMHDSWMPLAGLMPLWNILIGEMLFGGIGCGMYCMLFHVLITVFIAGLMIGRTPEYLGKKLDAWCATWAVIGVLIPNVACLLPTALAVMVPQGLSSMNNGGPHGLSEVLYCFAEAANNNGSAFAGLNANTPFYNIGAGHCHLDRAVHPDHCHPGHCGPAGLQEDRRSLRGHAAHARLDLRPDADRGHHHRRGADLLPGAVSGADCGARIDAGRPRILSRSKLSVNNL